MLVGAGGGDCSCARYGIAKTSRSCFNRENLLRSNVEPGLNGFQPAKFRSSTASDLNGSKSAPGVRSATVSLIPLLAGYGRTSTISVQGHTSQPGDEDDAKVNTVGESFFETMEIPLLLGRALNSHDDERAPKVAVINQMMARKYFGDENPLGRRFGLGGPETSGQIEIVGVARDAKYTDMRRETEPTVYLPYPQSIPRQATFIVRSSGSPTAIVASVRGAVREVDSNLPIFAVKTQNQQADESSCRSGCSPRCRRFFGRARFVLVLHRALRCDVLRRRRPERMRSA